MNFCVNCQFYRSSQGYTGNLNICERKESEKFNVVTGEPLIYFSNYCETERDDESLCGPTGRYFLEK